LDRLGLQALRVGKAPQVLQEQLDLMDRLVLPGFLEQMERQVRLALLAMSERLALQELRALLAIQARLEPQV
jgi:hypothetical protein